MGQYGNAALQERVARRRRRERAARRKKFFIFLTLLLVIAGVSAGGFGVYKMLSTPQENATETLEKYESLPVRDVNYLMNKSFEHIVASTYPVISNAITNIQREIRIASIGTEVDPTKPMVALTFDDGPYPKYTSRILDALQKVNGRATFFVLGERCDGAGDVLKRANEMGCEIGNHSFDHENFAKITASDIKDQLKRTSDLVYSAIGVPTALTRVPYGELNQTVRDTVGTPIIGWSVDTLDWKSRNADAVVEKVLNNVGDGDIVLMHDIYKTSAEAAERIIPELVSRGYQLVTVSELMEAREVELTPGKAYNQAYKKK